MTIYRRPDGLIDPNPTLAQSLGAIVGTLGGKALTNYSQNRAINNIQEQLQQQGVSPALATLAAAQVGTTGTLSAPIANLIQNQKQAENLSNYYQKRWGLSPEQATTLAGTPESIQKQEIQNFSSADLLRNYTYNQNNQTNNPSQNSIPGLPGLVINQEFSPNTPNITNIPNNNQIPEANLETQTKKIPTEKEILTATLINSEFGKQLGKIRETELNNQTNKEKQYFKFNEPKVAELNNTLQTLEIEDARFERLEDLNKNYSYKFPSRLTASWFTKNGQINKLGQAFLSDEAQEFIKLVQDNLSGAKNTFGARVTNFDVDSYLKRLPSLLNSPGGRERVLRDLRLINQINRDHAQGVLDIFEKNGGTDKIAYSKVESIYRKNNKDKINNWRKEFVQGKSIGSTLKELPNASENTNRTLINKKTGEYLRSDGKNWIPLTPEQVAEFKGTK